LVNSRYTEQHFNHGMVDATRRCAQTLSGWVFECNRDLSVRREKALVHSGNEGPPGNWIAPPGSNRSGGGGNEAAEASGVEGR